MKSYDLNRTIAQTAQSAQPPCFPRRMTKRAGPHVPPPPLSGAVCPVFSLISGAAVKGGRGLGAVAAVCKQISGR